MSPCVPGCAFEYYLMLLCDFNIVCVTLLNVFKCLIIVLHKVSLLCTNLEINSARQKTEPQPKSLLLQDVMKEVGDLQKRDLR